MKKFVWLLALLLALSSLLPAFAEEATVQVTMTVSEAWSYAETLKEAERYDEYAALLETLAQAGHIDACMALGKLHIDGVHVKKDVEKAIALYLRAYDAGHEDAAFSIAYQYASALGDYAAAIPYYEKAAQNGSAAAMNNLALLYRDGKGVDRDLVKAEELFILASHNGNTRAMHNLANAYYNGTFTGGTPDYEQAVKWYEVAAEKGLTDAMVSLGRMYMNGTGVEASPGKAEALLVDADLLGEIDAAFYLGYGYANGLFSAEGAKDYEKAAVYYEKAMETGERNAANNLALLYLNGNGVEPDAAKALALFEQSAAGGSVTAMENLGRNYKNGKLSGGTPDYVKAAQWFLKAAEKNSLFGAEQAADLYLNERLADDGTVLMEKDYVQGLAAVKHADRLGTSDPFCLSWLGYFYEGHQGLCEQDFAKAEAYYLRAAEQDDTYSMHRLGMLHKNGSLGEANAEEALAWFDKAAALGRTDSMIEAAMLYTDRATAEDYQSAFRYLVEAGDAVNDDPLALSWLGYFYSGNYGIVAEADYQKAAEYYTLAAEQDDTYSMFMLASLYKNGRLGERDPLTAMQWYGRAAALGHAEAAKEQALLALSHYTQTGEIAQYHETIFQRLVEAGDTVNDNTTALEWLGFYYAGNHGVVAEPDYEKALAYYNCAAQLGSGYAMAQLGLMCRDGHYFEANEDNARAWFEKAVEAGYDYAQTYLDKLSAD